MECFGVGTAQADDLLQGWALRCHTSPQAIAHVLVHQVWQGDETYADTAVARAVEDALRNLPTAVAVRIEGDGAPETVAAGMPHLKETAD